MQNPMGWGVNGQDTARNIIDRVLACAVRMLKIRKMDAEYHGTTG